MAHRCRPPTSSTGAGSVLDPVPPPPMAYATVSFYTAKAALLAMLDSYWSTDELGRYLIEALRMWQALTKSYRKRVVVGVDSTSCFYDLRHVSAMTWTVLDSDLISEIQYHLCEPVTGSTWTSEQFTVGSITKYLERNRDRLLDTNCYVDRMTQYVGVGPTSRVQLTSAMVGKIRRLGWRDFDGNTYPVRRETERNLNAFMAGWVQGMSSRPVMYSESLTPPVQVQLAPVIKDVGTLDILGSLPGPSLDPSTGVEISVPDDFCWAVKYATLADMLSVDGRLQDNLRSGFCRELSDIGMSALDSAVVLNAAVNDIPVPVDRIESIDGFNPGWQNTGVVPSAVYTAGRNMVCVEKPSGVHSIALDIVADMEIPHFDTDYLQIGAEHLRPVYGMAQCIANFKLGGSEFAATFPLMKEFLAAAAKVNTDLENAAPYRRLMERV